MDMGIANASRMAIMWPLSLQYYADKESHYLNTCSVAHNREVGG